MKKRSFFAALALVLNGCVVLPSEVKDQIAAKSETTQNDLVDWHNMTDDQQRRRMWAAGRFEADMDFVANDRPIPTMYMGTYDDWIASLPKPAEIAAPSSESR